MSMDRLQAIVDAATPGPWVTHLWPGHGRADVLAGTDEKYPPRVASCALGSRMELTNVREDAEFIATFDPSTVQVLLDVARAAEDYRQARRQWPERAASGAEIRASWELDAALDRLTDEQAPTDLERGTHERTE